MSTTSTGTASTSSTGVISFSGLSSGLDTNSIITALTATETTQQTELQTQETDLEAKQTAYATLSSQLSAISQAAGTLNTASTYNTVDSSVGDTDVASITTTAAAAVGSYDLVVNSLAKANKIASSAQTDTTSALGESGTASVNGKTLTIAASDSLTAIAQKVNSLGAGVTASVMNGGTGNAYLTLSSSSTGTANAVSVADLSGTAFSDLGLAGTGSAVRQTSGNAAVGYGFSSDTTAVGTLLGASGLSASTVTIGGTSISIDPSTDTLDDVASKINAAGISGVTASVQSTTTNGTTSYSLQISGANSANSMSDGGGLLAGLGILRDTPGNELVQAQNASYSLDGVALTSSTNAVTGVIAGATLTLKQAGTTEVDLTQDTSAITTGVSNLVTAANSLFSTIASYSTFDSSSYDTGVLFGDAATESVKSSVQSLLFSNVAGATGTYDNLAQIGLGLDSSGNVTFDQTAFQAALSTDPDSVKSLLQSMGTGSTDSLKYVSATSAAKASSSTAPYAVNVTQAATTASFVAGTAETSARTNPETLTFTGSAFGVSGIAVTMPAGTGLADTVTAINSNSSLKNLVTASIQDGKLRIDAKNYGTAGDFTLTSNYASSDSNSGVGVGGEGTYVAGLDVEGTINGEAATGNGQFLTGNSGNATTEGLQIQYTGTTTGAVGTISYSRGLGSQMSDLITSFTDPTNGLLTAANNSLQTQVDGINSDITTVGNRITDMTTQLQNRFAAMESALSTLKAQSTTIADMLGTSTTSS